MTEAEQPAEGLSSSDLRQIRTGLRLTVREFASVVDVSWSLVGHWENERRDVPPDMDQLIRDRVDAYCLMQIAHLVEIRKLYTQRVQNG